MKWSRLLLVILLMLPAWSRPKPLLTMKSGGSYEQYLAYSPNGRLLVCWLPQEIQLWDPKTGKKLAGLGAAKRSLIGFSRDSRRIFTVKANGKLEGWSCPDLKPDSPAEDGSFATSKKKWFFHKLSGFVVSAGGSVEYPYHGCFSQAAQLWASTGFQTAEVYKWPSGQLLFRTPDVKRDVTTVVFRPDGQKFAFGTMGGVLYVLPLVGREKGGGLAARSEIRSIAASQDRLAVGCADLHSQIVLADWTGTERTRLDPPSGDTWALAFSPDGRFLASGHELGEIHIWRL